MAFGGANPNLEAFIKNERLKIKNKEALTSVAQLVGGHPARRKVAGLTPVCVPYRRQLIDVSLPLFLPPFPLSKNK